MNKVKLYGDLGSQPTRAVYWFMLLNKNIIDHELKIVHVSKFENRSEEFSKINPFKQVPVIEYNNQYLLESHTILRFLAQEFKMDKYYGPSLENRCKVDTYLDWHHLGLRKFSHTLFYQKYMVFKHNKEQSLELLNDAEINTPKALKLIESYFLKMGQNKFIAGDQLSIADLSCFCELKQLDLIKFDFSRYKVLSEWMKNMEKVDGYQESNKILFKMISKINN